MSTPLSGTAPNRLAQETSPYLLQHAHNPVDWYAWGEDAWHRARTENKPILLSIGYSACHWCHVMAHESFEDAETAALMNANFINIKVDREERPDLDKIYQSAHHLLHQRGGGWPLTAFLMPADHTPFFVGTYFPREPRWGMPSFKELLKNVAHAYLNRGAEIAEQNESLRAALAEDLTATPASGSADLSINAATVQQAVRVACAQAEQAFDVKHGGFGQAPKFPHPTTLQFLLRQHQFRANPRLLHVVQVTLLHMAAGGIVDQLGGGFARYSVDGEWQIPHFEKMLYDNGLLLEVLAQCWSHTHDGLLRETADGIGAWLTHEMCATAGGFFAALDADSEGHEGKFYVWHQDEIRALLTDAEYAFTAPYFGLDQAANFEGQWHLRLCHPLAGVAERLGISTDAARMLRAQIKNKLLAARALRVRPGCDHKILTAWNALMISGLCAAARAFNDAACQQLATRTLDFIHEHLWREQKLYATHQAGQARYLAYLDDVAFTLAACLQVLSLRWEQRHLQFAIALADYLLDQYQDPTGGGFFFTARDHERLLMRSKTFHDEAVPAGNAVAAAALIRLGYLLDAPKYLHAAERTLQAALAAVTAQPFSHARMLMALQDWLTPPLTIILRGPENVLDAWQRVAAAEAAHAGIYAIAAEVSGLPAALALRAAPASGCVAYLCHRNFCEAPIHTLEDFRARLQQVAITDPGQKPP